MAEGEGGGLKRLIKLVIILLVVLLLIVAGIFGAMYILESTGGEMAAGSQASAPQSGTEVIENPQYLDLGSFVVNLADGRRYLKTTIQLLLNEPEAMEFLQVRQAEVKDLVLAELQSLAAEQLRDPKERTLLKQRLARQIESLLPTRDREWDDPKPLKKVLITEFYLQ